MSRSLEELFDLIHRKQAEGILEILERGDVTAAEINAINKFLADNNVTGIKGENKALNKLSDGLAAFEREGNVTSFRRQG
jgi:hypothetical protein